MWFARVLGASTALLATAAVAAPGDQLAVTGDVVNVRAGPSTGDRVLLHVDRDEPAVELRRIDDWVQVQIPGRVAEGWIHQSLLRLVDRAPPAAPEAPAPAAPEGIDTAAVPSTTAEAPVESTRETAPPPTSEALALFRSNVEELNARAVALAGVELFSGAEPVDTGTVQVMVTDAWDLVPAAGQTSYTNALFDRWRAAVGDTGELRLQVVDPSGAVVSEKSGTGRF
jgi:hypothetical protein